MQKQSDRDIVVAALKHAAPYVRMYKNKVFVLKAGGEIFATAEGTRAFVEQIAILHQVGMRIVLVHGDTFSTVLGGLMGRLAGLRVGHVESGLRSFNLFHPFPEELNRLVRQRG